MAKEMSTRCAAARMASVSRCSMKSRRSAARMAGIVCASAQFLQLLMFLLFLIAWVGCRFIFLSSPLTEFQLRGY